MEDNKALLEGLFQKHTDGGIPENPEDMFNHDLNGEAALDILYEVMVASGCWEKED